MADDGKRIMHAHLKLNGGSLMLNDDFPEFGHGAASRTGQRHAAPAGAATPTRPGSGRSTRSAKSAFPLADQFWGDRYGQVKDPFGFTWSIGAPVKQRSSPSARELTTTGARDHRLSASPWRRNPRRP